MEKMNIVLREMKDKMERRERCDVLKNKVDWVENNVRRHEMRVSPIVVDEMDDENVFLGHRDEFKSLK